MMIKFLARGTGSAAAAADYLTREQNLSPEQKQDQDQDPEPEKKPSGIPLPSPRTAGFVNRRTPGRRDPGVNEHRRRPYAGSA